MVRCSDPPPLLALADNTGDRIWRNEGGLDRIFVTVFEARRQGADQVVLGQSAQDNWDSLEQPNHSWRYNNKLRLNDLQYYFLFEDRAYCQLVLVILMGGRHRRRE